MNPSMVTGDFLFAPISKQFVIFIKNVGLQVSDIYTPTIFFEQPKPLA